MKLERLVPVGLGVMLFAGCSTTTRSLSDRLPAADSDKTIHLISTTDLHGYILGQQFKSGLAYGGVDWMAGYFNIAKEKDPETLLFDSGDLFQGTMISNNAEGAPVIKFYNYAGYSAVTIGNHDFDFGPVGPDTVPRISGEDPQGALKAREVQAHFPFLSANICVVEEDPAKCTDQTHYQNASFTQPYLIKKVNGLNIGIIGLTTTLTPEVTMAANVAHLRFISGTAALERYVPEVKAKGADVIVVIAHIGGFCPKDKCNTSDELFKMIDELKPETRKQIPLILAGHTHNFENMTYNGVRVMINGHYGQSFGYLTLTRHGADGSVSVDQAKTIDFCHQIYSDSGLCQRGTGTPIAPTFLGETVVPDPQAAKLIEADQATNQALMDEIVGKIASPLTKNGLESSIGDFMTDALRFCYLDSTCTKHADLAIQNDGGIRSEIPVAGNVTYGQIFQVMPFDNYVATATISGAQFHGILAAIYKDGSGFPQVSGVQVELTPGTPTVKHTFTNDRGQQLSLLDPIVSIKMPDGSVFDESRSYTIVLEDFLATGGGTEFFTTALKEPPVIDYNQKVRDMLVTYIKSKPEGLNYSNQAPRLIH